MWLNLDLTQQIFQPIERPENGDLIRHVKESM